MRMSNTYDFFGIMGMFEQGSGKGNMDSLLIDIVHYLDTANFWNRRVPPIKPNA